MGLGDALVSSLSDMTGNVTKARIEILDIDVKELKKVDPAKISSGGTSFGSSLDGIKKNLTDAKIGSVLNSVGMAETLAGLSADDENLAQKKIYEVQFNPSQLTMTGMGGGRMAKKNYADNTGVPTTDELTFESMKARIELNVKLIFDQVDPQDAFMADKRTTSPIAATEGVIKAVRTATGSKKPCSVQKQVEGFIAALRSPNTRQITFSWSNMSYSGILNKVVASYTMFNVVGAPIRAIVDLSIVCADEGAGLNSMGQWQQAYDDAFSQGSMSYTKFGQKIGNIINI